MFLCDPQWSLGSRSILVRLLNLQSQFPGMILSWPSVPALDSLTASQDIVSLANTYGGYITVGYQRDGELPRYVPSKEPGNPLALRDLIATLPRELREEHTRVSFFLANSGTSEPPAAIVRVPRSLEGPVVVDSPTGPRVPRRSETGHLHVNELAWFLEKGYSLPAEPLVRERQLDLRKGLTTRQGMPVAASANVALLDWVVLPMGWLTTFQIGTHARASGHGRANNEDIERLMFIDSLRPLHWWRGQRLGRAEYFVADFGGLVLADAPLYWVTGPEERWKGLLSMTKAEALHGGAQRIFHRDSWEDDVRQLVEEHRHEG